MINTSRYGGQSVLLPDGSVIYLSGFNSVVGYVTNAEIFNATTKAWTSVNGLSDGRDGVTATLLLNGKLLVTGGYGFGGFAPQSQLYDPATATWTPSGTLHCVRQAHTATLLPNGKVLIAGGEGLLVNPTNNVELYDPASGNFTTINPMNEARENHTATLLNNGKVLVTAGSGRTGSTNSAELFDPRTGNWTLTDPLPFTTSGHSATLLPNGKVLVAGGEGNLINSNAAVFDPASGPNGKWTMVSSMNFARRFHSATLLPNGKVLVAGGQADGLVQLATAELFDPVTAKWTLTAPLSVARVDQTATLLPNGKVLIAGGDDTNFNTISVTELYDVGLGFSTNWQPQIAAVSSPVNLGSGLQLTGSKFRGLSEGSGGNGASDSPSDCPVVQLRNLESGRLLNLASTNWNAASLSSSLVSNFPVGWALATVFVNGIPGTSSFVEITPTPTAIRLTSPAMRPDGSFQLSFTNNPGSVFTVLTTTNLSSGWSVLGSATEFSSGQFRFVDSTTANAAQRYYRVQSP
jgi:N-acetylneuraminic acid mutarotase